MSSTLRLDNISPNARSVTKLEGLVPQMVDADYLAKLGVSVTPAPETLAADSQSARGCSSAGCAVWANPKCFAAK